MPQLPTHLKIGKFEIPQTCAVPWEEMELHTGGNRLCRNCNKVVHDLTGMSESEIEALFERNGGSLCGNFTIDDQGNPIYFRDQTKPQKVRFLKHWAAAASIFLLYQSPQAGSSRAISEAKGSPILTQPDHPTEKIIPVVTPKTNTLLSGMILTHYGSEIHDTLSVAVFSKGIKLVTLQAVNGFFHHDFADKLVPTDAIRIRVNGKVFDPSSSWSKREYKGAFLDTTLGNAQNVQIAVDYTPPPSRKTGGVMVRPQGN